MYAKAFRNFPVDGARKLEELLVAVFGRARSHHVAGERGEQGGGAMAFVVMAPSARGA